MINLCTVSDQNYVIKGLTLYQSLLQHTDNFVLHYLCIDDVALDNVRRHKNKSLIAYDVNDLLDHDDKLAPLKQNNYRYFCWSLASYFTNYLMDKYQKDISYIDSDIFFHDDFQIILNAIEDKDIGIFRHRQFPLSSNRIEGLFNVGVVHFKSRPFSRKALHWWYDAVLNRKYPKLATCGDQRYLDAFLEFPEENIFIDGEIGHGAPWQWQLYDFSDYEKDGSIIWDGQKQKLIFTHFSQFEYNLKVDSYVPSTMHDIYTPLHYYNEIKALKLIYDEYYNSIKNTHRMQEKCE